MSVVVTKRNGGPSRLCWGEIHKGVNPSLLHPEREVVATYDVRGESRWGETIVGHACNACVAPVTAIVERYVR